MESLFTYLLGGELYSVLGWNNASSYSCFRLHLLLLLFFFFFSFFFLLSFFLPWRRKFSRRPCRDSNPRPFSHESSALTTEPSPLPSSVQFSSVQFSSRWCIYALEKSHIIYAFRPVSHKFTEGLNQPQCSSDWRMPPLALSRKIVDRFLFPRLSPPSDRWCDALEGIKNA